ncbi:MAG: ribonuclease E/G [Pseudomonadota bacterium]
MTQAKIVKVYTQTTPGAMRAVACNVADVPIKLFSQRWGGTGERARYGAVVDARLRAFADDLRGAFCELVSGEEAFLRLKSRDGLTEGQNLRVRIESEARFEKLARVAISDAPSSTATGFDAWCADLEPGSTLTRKESSGRVEAAFEEALAPFVTLPGGGKLHIERTRALTAFDIDSAGRQGKGSAGARALSLNQEAMVEMARQIALRGLGGAFVLDCVSPLHASAGDRLQVVGKRAFGEFGLAHARVLKPSSLGLLQASLPWRVMPIEDERARHPGETELLDLMRAAQRDADAAPTKFFRLSLGGRVWQAYQSRKSETDLALQDHFSGRVSVEQSASPKSEVIVQ